MVREAKALVLSAWVREHGKGKGKIRCGEIANGRYRAIDPWHHIKDGIVVRRLSPNNRKIEADEDPAPLLSPDMLHVMGADLAGVHLGTADHGEAIARDLARRKRGWLKIDAIKMAKAVEAEHAAVDSGKSPDRLAAAGRPSRGVEPQALACCSFIASERALSSTPFTLSSRSTNSMTATGAESP